MGCHGKQKKSCEHKQYICKHKQYSSVTGIYTSLGAYLQACADWYDSIPELVYHHETDEWLDKVDRTVVVTPNESVVFSTVAPENQSMADLIRKGSRIMEWLQSRADIIVDVRVVYDYVYIVQFLKSDTGKAFVYLVKNLGNTSEKWERGTTTEECRRAFESEGRECSVDVAIAFAAVHGIGICSTSGPILDDKSFDVARRAGNMAHYHHETSRL